MKENQCYSCNEIYEYCETDIVDGCDTIEGQYIEYEATRCPICGCENKV